MLLENVILKPLITEKATVMADNYNRYTFLVQLKSNKNQIKRAVEELYDVKVLNVKTIINAGKVKRIGRFIKKTSKSKKAFVQLKEGNKIKLFDGV